MKRRKKGMDSLGAWQSVSLIKDDVVQMNRSTGLPTGNFAAAMRKNIDNPLKQSFATTVSVLGVVHEAAIPNVKRTLRVAKAMATNSPKMNRRHGSTYVSGAAVTQS